MTRISKKVRAPDLVLALGAITNRTMIPGSEHAFTFKTLADAFSRWPGARIWEGAVEGSSSSHLI